MATVRTPIGTVRDGTDDPLVGDGAPPAGGRSVGSTEGSDDDDGLTDGDDDGLSEGSDVGPADGTSEGSDVDVGPADGTSEHVAFASAVALQGSRCSTGRSSPHGRTMALSKFALRLVLPPNSSKIGPFSSSLQIRHSSRVQFGGGPLFGRFCVYFEMHGEEHLFARV